ncbi:MAG: hypothetical protein O7G84_05540 [Gammaproteobacteria bacterium]|nr:hypothetical protein [Gammaproteobacteria bacterium]
MSEREIALAATTGSGRKRRYQISNTWSPDGRSAIGSEHSWRDYRRGYQIRCDHQSRWYFKRPDGRSIPGHGYNPKELAADEILLDGASAEAFVRSSLNKSSAGFRGTVLRE